MKDPIFHRLLQLHPKFSDLSLGRINQLLRKIGFNEKKLPKVIHIAGTNGKGSVTSFLRSIFESADLQVHTYTSPHLIRFNERIRINGVPISDNDIISFTKTYREFFEKYSITFFEEN